MSETKSNFEKECPVYFTISYTFSDGEDNILGSSDASGPYVFCLGTGDCIPGLESRIQDMKEGEERSFVIPANEAYGSRNPALTRTISKSILPEPVQLQEGSQITINNRAVPVLQVNDDTITIDENHPLAGIDLHFTVRVESIDNKPPKKCSCGGTCGCGGSCGCGGAGQQESAEKKSHSSCGCGGKK